MRVVTFGEIMLRLKTPGFERFAQADSFEASYGGGEANVAVGLACLGMRADFVTRVPDNDLGHAARMTLRKYGVGTEHVCFGGDRLGIYFLESGAVHRGSKVVYDRANSALSQVEPGMFDWDRIFDGATWFHWTGITPAVSEGAALVCAEALAAARQRGLTVSVDLNYRKKLWKWGRTPAEVMPDLVANCDVILGNEEDAEKVFGMHAEGVDVTRGTVDASAYESVGRQLTERFPQCKKAVITLRTSHSASHNSWSAVLWNRERLVHAPSFEITHIVDRVGGGDSFMAGLIYAMCQRPADDDHAIAFAAAASALKHTVSGDFNLVTRDEVEKLVAGDGSGRVSR